MSSLYIGRSLIVTHTTVEDRREMSTLFRCPFRMLIFQTSSFPEKKKTFLKKIIPLFLFYSIHIWMSRLSPEYPTIDLFISSSCLYSNIHYHPLRYHPGSRLPPLPLIIPCPHPDQLSFPLPPDSTPAHQTLPTHFFDKQHSCAIFYYDYYY